MRREKYAKNKVTGSRIYYFNGVRHGVREYYGAAGSSAIIRFGSFSMIRYIV